MFSPSLWLLCGVTLFGALLQPEVRALSKDYTDLLELASNDEFVWDPLDEAKAAYSSANSSEHEHTYQKRQVVNSSQLLGDQDFGPCSTATGEPGLCKPLIYCRMPELKDDVWRLVSQLCVIKQTSIGICCTERIGSRSGPEIATGGEGTPRIINNRPEQRGCGITTKQFPRITNGRPAEPDEWPWMAALLVTGLPYVFCGGALITDRHVLTAAHCVHKADREQFHVRLGEYNTHVVNETRARDFRIAKWVTHIDYDPSTYENDIALLRLDRPTIFNTYIWPVCMPPLNENWDSRVGIVTGWGTQTFGGPHSEVLMEVLVPVWKHNDCVDAVVEHVPETVLCAGAGGQDSCQGDSGGPLMYQLPNNRWVAIGIVSWGVRCGEAKRPGMYTRVDRYLHWIIQNSDI